MYKPIIQLNEESVKSELKEFVRNSVEDISEALWDSRVSAFTISDLNQKVYMYIENGVIASCPASTRMSM